MARTVVNRSGGYGQPGPLLAFRVLSPLVHERSDDVMRVNVVTGRLARAIVDREAEVLDGAPS